METMVTGPSRSTSTASASDMACSRKISLDVIGLSLDHPAGDGLVEIERARHGHMRLEVFETGLLQRPIGRNIKRVGFAEQPLELPLLEIDVDAAPHAFDADALMPARGIADVQMHVGLLAVT